MLYQQLIAVGVAHGRSALGCSERAGGGSQGEAVDVRWRLKGR